MPSRKRKYNQTKNKNKHKNEKEQEKQGKIQKWLKMMVEKRKYSVRQNERHMSIIEEWSEKTWPSKNPTHISLKWLSELIDKIDELWFDHLLLWTARQLYKQVKIQISNNTDMLVAAYVLERKKGKELLILLHARVFLQLDFHDDDDEKTHSSARATKSENDHHHHEQDDCECHFQGDAFQAGGKKCTNRIQCMTQILCHEMIHVLLTMWNRIHNKPLPANPHHEGFQHLVWRYFQHDDSQHGLIKGLKHKYTLEEIKQKVNQSPNEPVCFLFENIYLIGRPIRSLKENNMMEVQSMSGDVYEVHLGLLTPIQ